MHAKFSDQRIIRDHFRRKARWNLYRLARCENIEIGGIQYETALSGGGHGIPKITRVVMPHFIDVDQARVILGLVADDSAGGISVYVDRDRHPILDLVVRQLAANELELLLKFSEALVAIERRASANSQLTQLRSLANEHAEGSRRDL